MAAYARGIGDIAPAANFRNPPEWSVQAPMRSKISDTMQCLQHLLVKWLVNFCSQTAYMGFHNAGLWIEMNAPRPHPEASAWSESGQAVP